MREQKSIQPFFLELHYLPCFEYFSKLNQGIPIILEQHENFKKGSYRNRCYFAGANGIQRLTIPLEKGRNNKKPIREVRIFNEENWQAQHWQSIQSAYGNSPFFEFYSDEIKPFYEQKFDLLWDFNWQLLETFLAIIGLAPELSFTEKFEGKSQKPCYNSIKPENDRPTVNNNFKCRRYAQVFEERHGFLRNLSILDLLFCTGPAAISYLETNIKHS